MSIRCTFGLFWVISCIALTAVTAKSKYYDGEIRPYEFGYRIEGNQHRHEKKDANGLISGEFGFITGDGAYHQSVYATDESGNFKLISLKSSFRIVKSTTTTASPTTTVPPAPAPHSPKLLKVLQSCSNCKVFEKEIPDIPDKSSPTAPNVAAVTRNGEIVSSKNIKTDSPNNVVNQKYEKNAVSKLSISSNEDLPKMRVKSNSGTIATISPINVALGISAAGIKAAEQMKLKQKQRQELKASNVKPDNDAANINGPSGVKASEQIKLKPKDREENYNAKALNEIPSHQISKPVRSADVAIPVSLQTKSEISLPISTDNVRTKSTNSSKTHLSSKQAINEFIGDILYRFNYTAGYHGHNEEGDSAGNKRGGYFIIGRDNIRRGVIYVANSNGFIPVVKYEKVSQDEAPHEDTEKSAGLRGYEFDWFHKGKSKVDSSLLKENRR